MNIKEKNVKLLLSMPNFQSKDFEWINWYEKINGRYGRQDSARLFMAAWRKRGSKDANTYQLRKVLSEDGINISEGVLNEIADLGGGISDSFGNIMKIGKYAAFAVGGILILGLGLLVYNVAKNPSALVGGGIKK